MNLFISLIFLIGLVQNTNYSVKGNDECSTPVDCYLKAVARLEQDRKEMRSAVDNLTKQFEEYKKQISESTTNQINSVVTPVGAIIFHSHAKPNLDKSDLPENWTVCDGRALLRTEFSELFSKLGTTYGAGDGTNSFNLPDLRGRTVIGAGQGAGLSKRNPGQWGGEEYHTLNIDEMPSHQHLQGGESLNNTYGGGNRVGSRTYPNGEYDDFVGQLTSSTGSNQPHNNMSPFITHHAIIRIK